MKYKRIIYHIVFWVLFILVYPYWLGLGYSDQYINNLLSVIIGLPGFLAGLYFIIYYLIPNLLLKGRRYLLFIVVYLFSIITLTFHEILINRYVFLPIFDPDFIVTYDEYAFTSRHIFRVFVMIQSQIFIFFSIKYLKNYIEDYIEKEKLKTKMIETELKMLKGQLHPHFLFNTLNNIYTLSLDCNNEILSDSIAKLSDVLRFTIYESNNNYITIKKEFSIISDYIELEKLRYSNLSIEVSFQQEVSDYYTLPLLLFTFIENAFKHGVSKTTGDKWLKVKIYRDNDEMVFSIKNSKSQNQQANLNNHANGIGINNAQKRLDLSLGKNQFILELNDKNDSFEVYLRHKIIKNDN